MKITKQFEFEMAHYVPNATSQRCSHSTHGHSYKCFVTLEGRSLDFAGMLLDFGLFKGTIKDFIDSMDHCLMFYNKVPGEYQDFVRTNNERWISVPFIPSAEMMSIFVMKYVNLILGHTRTANGEGEFQCISVKLYETRTGSAECDLEDVENCWICDWDGEIEFSDGVINDWGKDLFSILFSGRIIDNPTIKQQVPYFNKA